MQELGSEADTPQRIFKAGQFWSSNVFGAALGGAGAGILMFTVMCIAVWEKPTSGNILFAAGLVLVLIISILCFLPGNWIAAFPYAVELEDGKGLVLYAPLKKIYIPIEDVRDVRSSFFQQGYVVRLKRRHRLLTSFVINRFFGDQAELLARAIQEEIRRHGP